MRRRTFLAGLGFAALQLAGCAAKPQTTPDYVLTYADNQPAGYPTTQGAQYFADLVQQQTGGKVVIQVKANGEYGSEQQVWEQLAIGGVDFARVSLSVATDDLPRLNVLLLPYLYRDADHMWRVLDGSIGAEFLQDFTAQGRVVLSWYDAGARSFYARQPVRSLNDLQGKTIRVQNACWVQCRRPRRTAMCTRRLRPGRSMPPKTTGRPTIPWSTTRWHGTTWPMSIAAYRKCSWLPAAHGMHYRRNTGRPCKRAPGHRRSMSASSGHRRKQLPEKRHWLTGAGNCRCPKKKCRTSGNWCSRYTGNTVPTICRWWRRYRQSDNRERDESNKKAHSFEVMLRSTFPPRPLRGTANKPDPPVWLVCNIKINVSAEYTQGAAEDLLNQKLSLSSHIHRSR